VQVLAEPTGGHEEIVDVGRRGRRYRRWVFEQQPDRVHTDPGVLGDPQGHIEVGPMTPLGEQLVGVGDAGPPGAGVRVERSWSGSSHSGCSWMSAGQSTGL